MELLKFTYLPQISNNINKAKSWFRKSMEKTNMRAYYIVIVQKLSFWIHYEWSFQNNIHIETSSAFDNIVENLLANGKINNKSTYVICNGFKEINTLNIAVWSILVIKHHPIIDNFEELDASSRNQRKIQNWIVLLKKSLSLNFILLDWELGIKYCPFYKKEIKKTIN
jgi:arginine decarboxylase